FFFSSRRRHTRSKRDWSSDVCSSDLEGTLPETVVIPTTSSSGDVKASIKAKLSSIPGSQSMITFCLSFISPTSFEILGFLYWEVYEPVQAKLEFNECT